MSTIPRLPKFQDWCALQRFQSANGSRHREHQRGLYSLVVRNWLSRLKVSSISIRNDSDFVVNKRSCSRRLRNSKLNCRIQILSSALRPSGSLKFVIESLTSPNERPNCNK